MRSFGRLTQRIVVAGALAVAFFTSLPAVAAAPGETPDLDQLIADVQREPSDAVRWGKAMDLAMLLKHLADADQLQTISDATVDALADLVIDPTTRLGASAALGQIGARAVRAVPALQAAFDSACNDLRARNFVVLGLDDTMVVGSVLERITGRAPVCV